MAFCNGTCKVPASSHSEKPKGQMYVGRMYGVIEYPRRMRVSPLAEDIEEISQALWFVPTDFLARFLKPTLPIPTFFLTNTPREKKMAGLGLLSVLPPEIRTIIWQVSPISCFLPLLQSSREINREVSHDFFKVAFLFNIRGTSPPSESLPGYCSKCSTKNSIDWSSFGVNKRCPKCLDEAHIKTKVEMLECPIPFAKFPKTVVEIHPPDTADPGQLLQTWSGLSQVVKLISATPNQSIEICFKEDDKRSWFQESEGPGLKIVQTSISGSDTSDLDYLVPLCLFLRGAKKCTIHVLATTEKQTSLDLNGITKSALLASTRPTPFPKLRRSDHFGYGPPVESSIELDAVLYYECYFRELEQIPDSLQGPMASFLWQDPIYHWQHYDTDVFDPMF